MPSAVVMFTPDSKPSSEAKAMHNVQNETSVTSLFLSFFSIKYRPLIAVLQKAAPAGGRSAPSQQRRVSTNTRLLLGLNRSGGRRKASGGENLDRIRLRRVSPAFGIVSDIDRESTARCQNLAAWRVSVAAHHHHTTTHTAPDDQGRARGGEGRWGPALESKKSPGSDPRVAAPGAGMLSIRATAQWVDEFCPPSHPLPTFAVDPPPLPTPHQSWLTRCLRLICKDVQGQCGLNSRSQAQPSR